MSSMETVVTNVFKGTEGAMREALTNKWIELVNLLEKTQTSEKAG